MRAPSWSEEFGVLLADESVTRVELFDEWLPGLSTRLVSDHETLATQYDPSITVACLSRALLGEREKSIKKRLLGGNPFCQLVSIVPRASFVEPFEREYDDCLVRPVFKRELQETVEERWKCGVYGYTLHEFYHLSAELASNDRASKNSEDGPENPERLLDRYQEVKDRLDSLGKIVDHRDVRATLESLRLHGRYLEREPSEAERRGTSKYYPDRCPHCKLPWGVDHRNKLGEGYEPVAAHVWKCTRCNKMVHGLGASHRRIPGH